MLPLVAEPAMRSLPTEPTLPKRPPTPPRRSRLPGPIGAWVLAALGNVIDRLLHGHVVDFLQFHWSWLAPMFPGGYFPSFNIADSAITAGAVALILDELLRVRRSR